MGLDIHATNNLTKIPKEDIPYGVEPYNDKFYQWEQDMDVYLRYIDRSNGEGENYWSKHSDPFETGRIGPLVSAELYNDFVTMEEKVFEFIDRMSYGVVSGQKLRLGEVSDFKELYEDWKYAFELAKEGGEVMLM